MPVDPESNLAWRAFLYVSGDLPGEETQAFEDLLLEDQAAREAVASAVELIQALGVLGRESSLVLPGPRRARKPRTIAAVILLASAAMVFASVLIPANRTSTKVEPDASAVAIAWSGIHGGVDPDGKAVAPGWNPNLESIDPSSALETEESGESAAERPLPSWLLSAASAPRSEPSLEDN